MKLKSYELAEILNLASATITNYERDNNPIPRVVEYALYGIECERDIHS
jgi:hypothetical protein